MANELQQPLEKYKTILQKVGKQPQLQHLTFAFLDSIAEFEKNLNAAGPKPSLQERQRLTLNLWNRLEAWRIRAIGELNRLTKRLINQIIHSPRYQRLEASWRGLAMLVRFLPEGGRVKLRILHAKWSEVADDVMYALEPEQSALFHKLNDLEYGVPGGEPFGLLAMDYEVSHIRSGDDKHHDTAVMQALSEIASSAFIPVLLAAKAELFEVKSFTELDMANLPEYLFNRPEYRAWLRLRRRESSRFLGLLAPRILIRKPYIDKVTGLRLFEDTYFESDASSPNYAQGYWSKNNSSNYLWGNPAYAFAQIAIRSFTATGWFNNMLGAEVKHPHNGIVEGLETDYFDTDAYGDTAKIHTEAAVDYEQERRYAALGMIPLGLCGYAAKPAIYSAPTLHCPTQWSPEGNHNEQLACQLPLWMGLCRFAHYLKVMIRDWVGKIISATELEDRLQRWIVQYVALTPPNSEQGLIRYPLREARVRVSEVPASPGGYACHIWLRPHVYGADVDAALTVRTKTHV